MGGRERFQEQQRDRSGGETAREYSAGILRLQRKENHPGEAYERTVWISFYSWGMVSLEGPHKAGTISWTIPSWLFLIFLKFCPEIL